MKQKLMFQMQYSSMPMKLIQKSSIMPKIFIQREKKKLNSKKKKRKSRIKEEKTQTVLKTKENKEY